MIEYADTDRARRNRRPTTTRKLAEAVREMTDAKATCDVPHCRATAVVLKAGATGIRRLCETHAADARIDRRVQRQREVRAARRR